jgi:hypothetical protein
MAPLADPRSAEGDLTGPQPFPHPHQMREKRSGRSVTRFDETISIAAPPPAVLALPADIRTLSEGKDPGTPGRLEAVTRVPDQRGILDDVWMAPLPRRGPHLLHCPRRM